MSFRTTEKETSQIHALQLLMQCGYEYIPPSKALFLRHGNVDRVLLEPILREFLNRHNKIETRGQTIPFSEANISESINRLKELSIEGRQKRNEKIEVVPLVRTVL